MLTMWECKGSPVRLGECVGGWSREDVWGCKMCMWRYTGGVASLVKMHESVKVWRRHPQSLGSACWCPSGRGGEAGLREDTSAEGLGVGVWLGETCPRDLWPFLPISPLTFWEASSKNLKWWSHDRGERQSSGGVTVVTTTHSSTVVISNGGWINVLSWGLMEGNLLSSKEDFSLLSIEILHHCLSQTRSLFIKDIQNLSPTWQQLLGSKHRKPQGTVVVDPGCWILSTTLLILPTSCTVVQLVLWDTWS